ncbi:lipopolysaccharide kinase InaA family protein [Arenicella xantha]|uniref:Lipopolysaccharide kinase (Kdo/WaaP) family protein n=1 Tax=Arenicella xantha TaxID=644221 RepID=A0A395JGE4_9GAMM|nr:lipopolysaccharide kinase InaA family protein [Arenicella xantha]RBP48883.1 lipopolysaccharide kinase (Kdo/WaaP) family protein [Arenicella xantha]
MNDQAWAEQTVLRSVDWFSRVYVSQSDAANFPTDIAALERLLADTADALKHDRTTTVMRVPVRDDWLILKRYNPRNAWHKVKRALRRSRARRCWNMSYAFQQAGLNVARPIMMCEHRFGPFRGNAYFASELLDGSELLTALPQMDEANQAKVKQALDDAFQRMRSAKISHGDLKASNLIWSNNALYFIDLDAAKQHWTLFGWHRSHRKDRRRFLKNWQDSPMLSSLFNKF